MNGYSTRRRPPHPGKPAWPTPQQPRQRTVNRRFELRPRWWRRLMPWLIAAILSLATPAPADEVELPKVAWSGDADFWIRDTETTGHWTHVYPQWWLVTWNESETGEMVPEFTPASPDEAYAVEHDYEGYGGR